MIIKDTEGQHKYLAMQAALRAEAERQKWIEHTEEFAHFVVDGMDNHPFDDDARWGRWMTTADFERKLQAICPQVAFRYGENKLKTSSKWMMAKTASGKFEDYMTYPNPRIPERSLWRQLIEHKMDRTYGRPQLGGDAMDTKDFPMERRKWVPIQTQRLADELNAQAGTNYTLAEIQSAWEPNGKGIGEWIFEPDAVLPGMKKIVHPWGEFMRGYRTILLRLVIDRYISPAQAETTFLRDQTPEWAAGMGHHAKSRPW